jgi:hypothetical protein
MNCAWCGRTGNKVSHGICDWCLYLMEVQMAIENIEADKAERASGEDDHEGREGGE